MGSGRVANDRQLFPVSAQTIDVVPQPDHGVASLIDDLGHAHSRTKIVVDRCKRDAVLYKRFPKKAVCGFISSLPVAAVNKDHRGRGLRLGTREIVQPIAWAWSVNQIQLA